MQAVSSGVVARDRTYASAVALREWLKAHDMKVTKINLMAAGLHSRRSRLLFQKAFGEQVQVGVIAYEREQDQAEARRWWASSGGMRGMFEEGTAFLYARFFFRAAD